MAFLCSYIISLNDSSSSLFYHRLIKKAAVGGHSMGGGSSFLAATGVKPAIKALFNFAAAETNPSATAAASGVAQPSLIFSGSSDCIAAPSVQQGMYANLTSCKIYINITGGLHCQFANNNGTCAAGQFVSGCNSSSINATVVFNKTLTMLLPFLDYYLKGICIRGDDLQNAYNSITGVTKQRSCGQLPSCGILPLVLSGFSGVLNNNHVDLSWKIASAGNLKNFIVERSNDGSTFSQMSIVPAVAVSATEDRYALTDSRPFSGTSFYRLRIVENDGAFTYSNVVKITAPVKDLNVTGIFPNPVKSFLTLQVQSGRRQSMMLSTFDLAGRKVMEEKFIIAAGISVQNINLSSLPAGIYLLKYQNSDGNITGSLQVEKN